MIQIETSVKDDVTKQLEQLKAQLKALPAQAHKEFVALTPIDKGNARRRTTLKGNTISANYPYAQRLDEGWSKQAPDGMIKPLEDWLEKRLNKIMGK